MSYFSGVYLKRMNKDGVTPQERIKTRKENEFNKLFLKKSEYLGKIYRINENESNVVCSVQPNKWNESETVSTLLTSTSEKSLQTGDVLKIFQKIKEVEYDKIWIVLQCQENITQGYYSYKIICLNSEINITNEYGDTLYNIPVKFVKASETFVEDYFVFSRTLDGYREPQRSIKCITHGFPFLKKDLTFNYLNKTFKIAGIDDISIKGVSYLSLKERLKEEVEPRSSEKIIVNEDSNFFLINK